MSDPRVDRLADVLVNYSVAVKPGDRVIIRGDVLAAPLFRAVYAQVLKAGGMPLAMASLSGLNELLYRYASDEQLAYVHAPLRMVYEQYDVHIALMGSENTKALSNVDPAKVAVQSRAMAEVRAIYMQRAARGELRWTGTLFPTQAYAQDAAMSLEEYENFVYGACLVDRENPVDGWKEVSARQQKVVDWLKGKERVHLVGPGTDLRLSIAGRTFINCDGHYNMPDGEVFTGPVEDSVEGHITFSFPAIYHEREVSGIQLTFERGRVAQASATKGEDFLRQTLATDDGATRVGEFAIGTNEGIQRFTGEILFDEKIGGTVHMALGAGYPESGSHNESGIHWDMICDLRQGGEIWVDEQLMYKDGKFVI